MQKCVNDTSYLKVPMKMQKWDQRLIGKDFDL